MRFPEAGGEGEWEQLGLGFLLGPNETLLNVEPALPSLLLHTPTNQQTHQPNNQQTKQSCYKEKDVGRNIKGECQIQAWERK